MYESHLRFHQHPNFPNRGSLIISSY
ncbi:hypothetical protein MPL3356_90125 [Mesorhizobium plurifarium]|uniref:Uncharacterized protein n=1 Tax=Mesorhizobium plurifarium TaxID=69974 RepID=A0A090EF88_MESPL|nr:hypothetical protein MPL3356_90125 [Mesorhizobium plurifarium]